MKTPVEWYQKGQESVRRKNESGCCCTIADDGETIISMCEAHLQHFNKMMQGIPLCERGRCCYTEENEKKFNCPGW